MFKNSRKLSRSPGMVALCQLALVLLTACSGPAAPEVTTPKDGADPSGAAQALSIGGRLDRSASAPFESAKECVDALKLIKKQFAVTVSGQIPNVMQGIDAAIEVYDKRAKAASAEIRGNGISGLNVMERDEGSATTEDRNRKAQHAIACIQALAAEEH